MRYSTKGGLTLVIKPSEIERIEYILGTQPTESITSVANRTKANYVINANFFNMATGKTMGEVTDEGIDLSDGMNPYGYGFVGKKLPVFSYNNSIGAVDFVGGYPCLLRNGTVAPEAVKPISGIDYGKKRGRTAIGMTLSGEFVVRVIPDKTLYPRKTIPQLMSEMKALGCVDAINLDGGGSSQFVSPDKSFNSGRKVDGFIAIWTTKTTPTTPKQEDYRYYTVKKGDTLYKIAKANDTSTVKLAELNGIKNPNLIMPGQRLRVK